MCKQAEKILHRVNRTLKALSECNQAVVHATEESVLLHNICKIIINIEGYCLAWVGFAQQDETIRLMAQAGYELGCLDTLLIGWANTEWKQGPIGTAIRTGKPSISKNILTASHLIPCGEEAIRRGYTSSIALPLLDHNGNPFGALNICAVELDVFDSEEVKLLSSLAANLSYGIITLRVQAENKAMTETLQKRTDDLNKRIKELNCLYRISHLVENKELSLLEIFQKTVEFIPPAWQYPEIASARIIFDDEEFRTQNFQETIWQQTSEIIAHNKQVGLVEVCYLEEKPSSDEKNFLNEERYLINAIAERMGRITELKQAEAALANERMHLAQRIAERTAALSVANAELARAARLKDEFLANMSHELRTPLNGILGLSEALYDQVYGSLNEKQLQSLRRIEAAGRHLLSMINDILDVSKIEAGKLTLQMDILPIQSLCKASLGLVKQLANKKQIIISQNIDQSVTIIQADKRRLKQILVNLLGNAIKFTHEGGKIGLEVKGEASQEKVYFTVWDTGIGIAHGDIKKLFQPFIQLDSGLTRRYEGTGLGLALVRRLTEMHGGSVSVESEEGKGSRFTISLPWKADSLKKQIDSLSNSSMVTEVNELETTPSSINTHSEAPLILVAEDNETTLKWISGYLQTKGYRVIKARNGAEAYARAKEECPSIILMDIQMPIMDGLEATRKIRANADNLAAVPIIAITAFAMKEDKERCFAAGINDCLTKPVRLKHLVRLIEAQLDDRRL